MLLLSKDFLNVFKQVLKYLEEKYLPNKYISYSDKFEMLCADKPYDKNDFNLSGSIELSGMDWREIKVERGKKENVFCKNFIAYLDNDLETLKACCKKAHLTAAAFEKICNGTFKPTKSSACNLIVSAKLNLEQATELLKAANIYCCQFNKFDVVMAFFFENNIYDFSVINTTLYLLDLPMLGYYYV